MSSPAAVSQARTPLAVSSKVKTTLIVAFFVAAAAGAGLFVFTSGAVGEYVPVEAQTNVSDPHGLFDPIIIEFSVPVSIEEARRGITFSPIVAGEIRGADDRDVLGHATRFEFVPDSHFDPGTEYELVIDDIESLAKSRLDPIEVSFETIDFPAIVAVDPAKEEVIDINQDFRLEFDHLSDDFEVDITFNPPADLGEVREGSTVAFTPETMLLQGQEYEVRVQTNVVGDVVESQESTAKIKTRDGIHIVESDPVDGLGAASQVAPIKIRFDRPVVQEGIENYVQIDPPVEGRFEWEDGTMVRFVSNEFLPEATEYSITIDPGLQALEDPGHMADGESFAFTTRKGNGRAIPEPRSEPRQTEGRWVEVDVSQQVLYAYEDGELMNAFRVSTGLPGMPTTRGDFAVGQKKPVTTYRWNYGEGDPRNYSLSGVQWNMRVGNSHQWLHGAYWHNNFGVRMSHGCINIYTPDAEWLYGFTEVGTPVYVYDS